MCGNNYLVLKFFSKQFINYTDGIKFVTEGLTLENIKKQGEMIKDD